MWQRLIGHLGSVPVLGIFQEELCDITSDCDLCHSPCDFRRAFLRHLFIYLLFLSQLSPPEGIEGRNLRVVFFAANFTTYSGIINLCALWSKIRFHPMPTQLSLDPKGTLSIHFLFLKPVLHLHTLLTFRQQWGDTHLTTGATVC